MARRRTYQFDDVMIEWCNFSGEKSAKFKSTERNFNIVVDSRKMYDELVDAGMNPKVQYDDEKGFKAMLLVKLSFDRYPPEIFINTNGVVDELTWPDCKDDIAEIDHMAILGADVDVNLAPWEMGGKSGITPWLTGITIYQRMSRHRANAAGHRRNERYEEED